MKHTDYYQLQVDLYRQAENELKQAVLAHGGEAIFFDPYGDEDFDADKYPEILASSWGVNPPLYHVVSRLTVENNKLMVYGYLHDEDEEGDDEVELEDYSVFQINSILEYIPEPEKH